MSTSITENEQVVPIERHLVHQTVLHSGRSTFVNPIFALRREVIGFLNLVGPNTLCDSNHPQELVDVIAGVSEKTAKDDEDVIDIVFSEDGIRNFLAA